VKASLTPFLNGTIRVHQPISGYRFNVDSVLLAGFSWVREGEKVLDLGTGSGILLLLLAHRHHPSTFMGIEIQPEMAEMAEQNLEENGWTGTGTILCDDFRGEGSVPANGFDLVVCNPPYFEVTRGKASPDPTRAVARQSVSASLLEVLQAGRRAMAPGGRFCLLCPALRLEDLLAMLPETGLYPRLIRMVKSSGDTPPYLALLQLRKTAALPCVSLPPLIIRDVDKRYTPEVSEWLGDGIPDENRFLCDAMLGKLAKYLRLLGYGAAYARVSRDDWLAAEAARTGEVLLTRDRFLLQACVRKGIRAADPGSDVPVEQLRVIRSTFGPFYRDRRPRCLMCNAPTYRVERGEALGKVPPYTYLTHRRFSACACCGTLTWEGSHLARFRKAILAAAEEDKP
jgi:tRNA1Val (adenine37-N6)-methyltransferase